MFENQKEKINSPYEEISLKEVLRKVINFGIFIKKKWKVLFFSAVIGGVIGLSYAYLQKTYYTATLTFALEDEKSSGGGLSGAIGIASSLGLDIGANGGGAFSGSNIMELMKSRRLVEQSLLRPITLENGSVVSIAEMYISFNHWRKIWVAKDSAINKRIFFLPNSDRKNFSIVQDSVLGLIYSRIIEKNLIVEQKDKKVSIISVEAKSENELFSKFFVEALAKEVSDFYIETKSKKAKLNVSILERQADSIRVELNNAIAGVAVANDNTYNLNPAFNVKRTPSAKRQVDVQANTAILTELLKNLEMAKVSLRRETPLIQSIDSPILPLAKEKPSKLLFLISGALLAMLLVMVNLIFIKWWRKTMTN